MKYNAGQTVILLDTEFKPAGSAIVRGYLADLHRYEVDFTYYGKAVAEMISVPEERLLALQAAFA